MTRPRQCLHTSSPLPPHVLPTASTQELTDALTIALAANVTAATSAEGLLHLYTNLTTLSIPFSTGTPPTYFYRTGGPHGAVSGPVEFGTVRRTA